MFNFLHVITYTVLLLYPLFYIIVFFLNQE